MATTMQIQYHRMEINMKKIFNIILTFALLHIPFFAQQTSPYDSEVVFNFAQSLYEDGFWDEAESEFKKSLFLSDAINQNEYSFIQEQSIFTLTTIYNQNDDKTGIQWLEKNFSENLSLDIKEKVDFTNARLIFKERNQEEYFSFIDSISTDLEEYAPSFQLLTIISKDLFLYNISDAGIKANEALHEYAQFEKFAKACTSYSQKNVALATTLSIFIPGAGKWYTGNFSSFLSSFLSITSFIGGTLYTGIESNWKDWRPYVFGTCALGLYITDIYGSYKAAKRYNEAQYRNLCQSLDLVYEESF